MAISNSGGKDCYLSMLRAQALGLTPVVSLTMLHETLDLSRSHGTPVRFLQDQAQYRGLPYLHARATWEHYERQFLQMLKQAVKDFGIEGVVFGDRCFEPNRQWGQKICARLELKAFHPIWDEDPYVLWQEAQRLKIDALICSCLPQYQNMLGHHLNQQIIEDLAQSGADIFGENGEYHTFVTNGLSCDFRAGHVRRVDNYCFFAYL